MLTDRYGLAVSTASPTARDFYVGGVDLFVSGYPGSVEAFDRALAADPGFALPHVAKARAQQLAGQMAAARGSLAAAEAMAAGLPSREASQVAVFGLLLSGRSDAALDAARAHLETWPRDAMVLSTCATQTGLIGMSGRPGREHALAELLDGLAPHYGDDWWFTAHHAMALDEVGRRDVARRKIERSMAQNPNNGWAAHASAHVAYESGECEAAIAFLRSWLPAYPSDGFLHGHLSWHLALFELQTGNMAEALRLYAEAFASEGYRGPALLKVIDGISFLWRAELAGHPRDPARWRSIHDFAHAMFPRAGNAFADWHVALADAVAGDGAALEARVREMEDLARDGRYPSGPVVPAFSRGFAAFARQDWSGAIEAIEPLLDQRERICGSRAQIDLVEFTLLKAYLNAGRLDEVRRLLRERRPGATGIPVAGLPAMH
jgi:tetratricopeptide (TPR) repeat protein